MIILQVTKLFLITMLKMEYCVYLLLVGCVKFSQYLLVAFQGLGSRTMTRQRMPMFTRKFTGQSPSENEQKFETIASHKTGGITPVYDSDCSQGKGYF